MDDPDVPQSVKNSIEFVVDISGDNNHILTYELKKNETRAVEAKKIREKVLETDKKNKNKERIDKDVLIIYMDNISRVHFHRKMKKLNRWLDQYSDNYEISQVASVRKWFNCIRIHYKIFLKIELIHLILKIIQLAIRLMSFSDITHIWEQQV